MAILEHSQLTRLVRAAVRQAIGRTLKGEPPAWQERQTRVLEAVRPGQIAQAEGLMEQAMRVFFHKVAASVVAAVRKLSPEAVLGGPTAAELLYREADWLEPLKDAATEPLSRAVLTGYLTAKALFDDRATEIKGRVKVVADGWDPVEGTFLEDWELPEAVRNGINITVTQTLAQPYWETILETTGKQLGGTLARAAEEVWSVQELTNQIKRDIGDVDGVRSKRIAMTEQASALNAGQVVQAHEVEGFGLTPIKIWVLGVPLVHRPTHVELEGTEVQGAEGLFNVGGYEVPYPGHWTLPPEERINCHCSTLTDLVELR